MEMGIKKKMRIKNYAKLADEISNWLKEYLLNNHLDCFIVGVSGGIDSAVVSSLCARTGIKTLACSLPIHSDAKNNSNAKTQLDWLHVHFSNVETFTYNMDSIFNSFFQSLSMPALVQANTKSRLRMVFLYAMAGASNGLVVGTGNMVEDFGIGFFTKYGDGGVDISPLGNLLKSEVRELGAYLGISNDIVTAVPTDGLWEDNRSDESQIGVSYEELEWAIDNYGKEKFDTEREQFVMDTYIKFHHKNLHKTLPIPIFNFNIEEYI